MRTLVAATLLGAFSAFALSNPSMAAPVPGNWTGAYLGVVGGPGSFVATFNNTLGNTTGDFNGSGLTGGGTAGFNWQMPGSPVVLGIEGDYSWANIMGTTSASGCMPTCTLTLNWIATARGRIGVTAGSTLAYATAGAAFVGAHPTITGIPTTDFTDTGWTAGAGIEQLLHSGWSLKAEYLYSSFGQSPAFFSFNVNGPQTAYAGRLDVQQFRVGVNKGF